MGTCLSIRRGVGLAVTAFGITAACAGPESPAAGTAPPTPTASVDADNPNSAASDEKRIIHGWFNGEEVDLRYTRLYFCAEPPESDVETGCVVGAPATIAPRSGPIPRIYALSPAGFIPSPETVHCPGGRSARTTHQRSTLICSRASRRAYVRLPTATSLPTARPGGTTP